MSKILIADDESMIRDLIKLSLEGEGHEIFEADDGVKAVDMAKKEIPDLMILDVMMPGIIGYRVCDILKSEPETRGIYVMFLTGRDAAKVRETAEMINADDVISKPFDPEALKQKVREALKS